MISHFFINPYLKFVPHTGVDFRRKIEIKKRTANERYELCARKAKQDDYKIQKGKTKK